MFWANVFAIFCTIFALTNGYNYGYYYNNQHRHGHSCHYYQQQCVARRGPPSCKQWCLSYYFDGYCYRPRYQCCAYEEKPGYCPLDPHSCRRPFSYHSTRFYECHHDFNCPTGYKCCKDSCYAHKVCKPCASVPSYPGTTTRSPTRDTEETTVKNPVTPGKVTPTRRPETTTEMITTKPQETTIQVVTTPTPEITTTEKVTTLAPTTLAPTTPAPTTPAPTTQKETTTVRTTITQAQTTPLTTGQDIEGSGDDDFEEPESARVIRKNAFSNYSDDEDFVEAIIDN